MSESPAYYVAAVMHGLISTGSAIYAGRRKMDITCGLCIALLVAFLLIALARID